MTLTDDLDTAEGKRILERLAAELERRGITADEIGRLSRLSMWQTVTKDNDGEAQKHDLYGFQLSPKWDAGPDWPVIQPGPVVKCNVRKPSNINRDTDKAVVAVLPDMQIGYYRHPDGTLEPTHDPDAIDAAITLLATVRPSHVVLLGDNLDLPEFGKYRLSPAFQQTTQATIDYATTFAARLRATVGPDCTIDWLAGNHEERIQNWLMDNARAAFGLRQGATTEGWPVLSVPHLCRLDDHQVTYHPGYPASDLWLTDNLKVIHGDRVKSRGSTAHVYLNEQKVSVIYGHIHRREEAYRTREDIDGAAEIMAASPGCLARIDGAVPSTKQGLDLDGRPLTRAEDWQNGIGVVTIYPDKTWHYESARIANGVAYFRGKVYAPCVVSAATTA